MNETLYKRGPDEEGVFWENGIGLAMRRLSIIDLENGGQPISSEDGSIVVVQNGEIYNYVELHNELLKRGHRFSSKSDTEILVHGYEQWGIDGLLQRIDGMYAFAILDKVKYKLFLARDRFGEKPLYIHYGPGRFVFASQMLTVAKAVKNLPSINSTALYLYLGLHYVPGTSTIFNGINKLLPGEMYEVDLQDASFKKTRYWELKEKPAKNISMEEFSQIMTDSVKSRMVADVPVGVFLSGGLDSSIVAAVASNYCSNLQTFSMGFKGSIVDESMYSQVVADHIGSVHSHFEFDLDEFLEFIPKTIGTMDEPVGDQAMLPVYWLSSEAVKHVKVVLAGEGADELFAGYSYYYDKAVRPSLKYLVRGLWYKTLNRKLWDGQLFEPCNETPSGFPLLTNEPERLRLLGMTSSPDLGDWYKKLTAKLEMTLDPLKRACLCDIETWLAEDLLMKFDKMAMANSLEGRAPFLNPTLAKAALELSLEQRVSHGNNKVILRKFAEKLLPEDIISRKKHGFVLPMRHWLGNDLKDELIEGIRACPDETLDKNYLEDIVRTDINQGVNRERLLYAIFVYTKWVKHAFDYLKN